MPGTYRIFAFIPDANAEAIAPDYGSNLFYASIYISITQS
jgi:hypothetical protein